MNPSHIEHIGIAVSDLKESIKLFEILLGVKCYNIEEVPDQKVRTAFFRLGNTKIELLGSTDPKGPVGRFLEKKGEGLHHIALAVSDVEGSLKDAETEGIKLIDAQPRKGAEGLNIAFLNPKSTAGVLIELCEEKI
ncbi:MAG: methylmalonyl-CoA epimerase [Bacteroidales bacterium]